MGVEVERDGRVQRIGARRELILSGGAINSPVLLLASGIGPAVELRQHGIEVKLDLPGVGKNLQDHYQASFAFKTSSGDTLNEAVMNPLKSAGMALQWLFTGTGQLAVGATEATLFCKSSPSEPVPDLQYQVLNFSSDSLKTRIAPLARLYLHLQRLPAEEPRRDHAARSPTARCRRGSSPTT